MEFTQNGLHSQIGRKTNDWDIPYEKNAIRLVCTQLFHVINSNFAVVKRSINS